MYAQGKTGIVVVYFGLLSGALFLGGYPLFGIVCIATVLLRVLASPVFTPSGPGVHS